MNCKKIIFVIAFLAVCGFLFNTGIPATKAMTVAEIQALIQQFQQQIAQLQERLAERAGWPDVWCHDFKRNLKHGDTGSEVKALITALIKQDFLPHEFMGKPGRFDEQIAAAVVGFQEKYREDILTPWNLPRGTGFVGSTTRAKLNELYGCIGRQDRPDDPHDRVCLMVITPAIGPDGTCREFRDSCSVPPGWRKVKRCPPDDRPGIWGWDFCTPEHPCVAGQGDCDTDADCATGSFCAQNVGAKYGQNPLMDVCESKLEVTPSITVISPNRGERWEVGKTYEIKWDAVGMDAKRKVDICLWIRLVGGRGSVRKTIATNVLARTERFSWRISEHLLPDVPASLPGNHFKVRIWTQDPYSPFVSDVSDNYFTIVEPEVTPPITIISPNGGERWEVGKTYEIKWDAVGIDAKQKVDISLEARPVGGGDFVQKTIATNVLARTERFSWRISEPIFLDIPGGVQKNHFKVHIVTQELPFPFAGDVSDNYFSIVKPVVGPVPIGLDNIANQVASISEAVSRLIERMRNL